MENLNLLAEVLILERELDEGQRMINHGRKTFIGNFGPVRAYLNRCQFDLDIQRMRVDAAKEYLESTKEI